MVSQSCVFNARVRWPAPLALCAPAVSFINCGSIVFVVEHKNIYIYTQVLEYVPRLAITPQQRTHRHISAQQNSTKGSLSLTIYYMNFFARPEEQLFTPMAIKESPHRCKKPRADVCKHINEHVQRLLDQKNRLIWEMMRRQTCAPRRLMRVDLEQLKRLLHFCNVKLLVSRLFLARRECLLSHLSCHKGRSSTCFNLQPIYPIYSENNQTKNPRKGMGKMLSRLFLKFVALT